MRVMWFTNGPMPAVNRRLGRPTTGSGHWMSSLLEHLIRTPGLTLDVVTAHPGLKDDEFEHNGVTYFVVSQPRFQSIFSSTERDLQKCVEIVLRRNPDLIHIHGSERLFGLMPARKLIPHPCVVSLQGFLAPCLNVFFGALSPVEFLRTLRFIEVITRRGLFWNYWQYRSGVKQEEEILAGATSFMGRTDWDRAHLRSANSTANYYRVGEVLRPAFREALWDISECERHTVIFTNAGEPRRGTEVLLRAMLTVRQEFPDAKLLLAGQIGTRRGYDRFLQRMIAELGLAAAVEFLGYLDASAMARALCRSHVFAISSYIENSPNSLCEAMQVGLPCVATYAGGIPSLVEHGRTGLLFLLGDAPLLADAIMRIFRDDDLAGRLGRTARAEASERHAPQRVLSQLLHAYNDVIANYQEVQEVCDGKAVSSY